MSKPIVHRRLIQINSDATKRARVWQWFQNEELVQRTVIEEVRVS